MGNYQKETEVDELVNIIVNKTTTMLNLAKDRESERFNEDDLILVERIVTQADRDFQEITNGNIKEG